MYKIKLQEKGNKKNKKEYDIDANSLNEAYIWGEKQAKELGGNYGVEVFTTKEEQHG